MRSSTRPSTRARTSPSAGIRPRIRRAVRWLDTWTVEAFNPVYPKR